MTYKEESYVLDTLKELKEKIRDMPIEQLIRETHENNIMLKQIIKVINTWFAHHNQENENDFDRNVLANMISSVIDFNKIFKQTYSTFLLRGSNISTHVTINISINITSPFFHICKIRFTKFYLFAY